MLNHRFQVALIISLVIHIMCFVFLNREKANLLKKKSTNLEVTYQKIQKVKKIEDQKNFEDIKAIEKVRSSQIKDVKILSGKREFVPDIGDNIKDSSKLTGKFRLEKKRTLKMHSFDKDQKVSISLSDTEKINNPKYLSYYSTIGSMIKQRVYEILGESETQRGEVYVTFLVSSDGVLQASQLKDERTIASDYLKELALASINEAGPFPPFPAGLDYPEFTFNIKLYFQPLSE